MYRLQLFGGVTVEGPAGPLTGRIAQRRQLALLAFLARQQGRPASRDKLLALFWPESDAERARHNLADGVYHIRKALGEESVVSVGDDLLLSTTTVPSDVDEFEAHLEAGDHEGAVALYAGVFMDGFHVSGCPEFERWIEGERDRLARAHLRALEALAEAAEAEGLTTEAVAWWRRAAGAAPHNTRVALRLMQALAAAGDRAGALEWASVHTRLLASEYDLEPDPELTALADRIRAAPPTTRSSASDLAREAAGGAHSPAPAQIAAEASEASGTSPPQARTPAGRPSRSEALPVGVDGLGRRPLLATGLLSLAAILLLAGVFGLGTGGAPPDGQAAVGDLDDGLLLVVPFRTDGAHPEVTYLGPGMVELLATKFSDGRDLRAVDPGVVFGAWWEGSTNHGTAPSREQALALARRVGARHLVIGGVVGTPAALSFSASMLDVATERAVAEGAVEGDLDGILQMSDRLAAHLRVLRAGEAEDRLEDLLTRSPTALNAFLHARAAHRRGDYEQALRQYDRALELDSTFALAGVGVNQVSGWVGGTAALQTRGRSIALAHLDRLSARDQASLLRGISPADPDRIPSVLERIELVQEGLRRWPDHPFLWYRLGDDFLHFGEALELTSWERRARESFERAIELDPFLYAEPVHHLAVILGEAGDTAALRALVEDQLSRHPSGPVADHLRWRAFHHLGEDAPALPPPLDAMDTDATLRWIGIEAQDYGFALDEGLRAVELRLSRPGTPDEHFERRRGAHAYALNRGRPLEALQILESVRQVEPDPHYHLRITMLTALYADGNEEAAERAAAGLAVAPTETPLGELNLCVRAQWQLAREAREPEAAARVSLPPAIPPTYAGAFDSRRVICSAVVRAQQAALVSGRADGPETQELDSLLAIGRHGGLVDDGHVEFAHVALARLFEEAGDEAAALKALRRRARYQGWQPYLGPLLREEGRLALQLGDTAGALRAWEHYLAFRTAPEPTLQDEADRIRDEVARLRGAGPE